MLDHVQAWSRTVDEVLDELAVAPDVGLDEPEIARRQKQYGDNTLLEAAQRGWFAILIAQLRGPVVVLLAGATVVSALFGEFAEAVAVGVVILLNTIIGFVTEMRAVRSMDALRTLVRPIARVRRAGRVQEIPARELVPGDVVLVEGGDMASADLRLIEASGMQADESALTGESMPVTKDVAPVAAEPVAAKIAIADRHCMLHSGTAVTRGSGEGVVVATGMSTELGHIARLVEEAEEEVTPLEKRLEELSKKLVWLVLAVAVVVSAAGMITGKGTFLMIQTGIALAVAAIPAGLPIVATLALAQGMWRMARRNVLINRLSSVETLGATTIIFTDKTGTLTENRMTVTRVVLHAGELRVSGEGLSVTGAFSRGDEQLDPAREPALRMLLEVGALCGNASLGERPRDSRAARGGDAEHVEATGDPVEVALLVLAAKAGLTREQLLREYPEEREDAFDPARRMMATVHRARAAESGGDSYLVAVKGACEQVLDACSQMHARDRVVPLDADARAGWLAHNERMAADGLRVLALARKTVDSPDAPLYSELAFLGLVGMLDPPRESVRDAIRACHDAHVQVVMVTGDQKLTARKVAESVGLDPDAIHARVDPERKLELVAKAQAEGHVVAMTGDGVNDAPALEKADIGIAMGLRGTEVARQASDMILKDDSFTSIVAAMEQGRVIYQNIRRFVVYLLSCNMSEIMIVAAASMIDAPLPILPLQILFLNLVTDTFPALALGLGRGDPDIMKQSARQLQKPILARRQWRVIVIYGALLTVAVMSALTIALTRLDFPVERAVTVSFLTLAMAQLWHVFNMRGRGTGFLANDVVQNPLVWAALGLCILLLLCAVYIPVLAEVLDMHDPGAYGWLLAIGMSLVPWLLGQVYNARRG